MDDAALMKVADGVDDGADDLPGLIFSVDLLFCDLIVEFPSREVLQNEVDIFGITVVVIELYDVGVLNIFHDVDLAFQLDLFLLVHLLPD